MKKNYGDPTKMKKKRINMRTSWSVSFCLTGSCARWVLHLFILSLLYSPTFCWTFPSLFSPSPSNDTWSWWGVDQRGKCLSLNFLHIYHTHSFTITTSTIKIALLSMLKEDGRAIFTIDMVDKWIHLTCDSSCLT